LAETVAPTEIELAIIDSLDPNNLRKNIFKDNPNGRRL
jgi:hypothetical protein